MVSYFCDALICQQRAEPVLNLDVQIQLLNIRSTQSYEQYAIFRSMGTGPLFLLG